LLQGNQRFYWLRPFGGDVVNNNIVLALWWRLGGGIEDAIHGRRRLVIRPRVWSSWQSTGSGYNSTLIPTTNIETTQESITATRWLSIHTRPIVNSWLAKVSIQVSPHTMFTSNHISNNFSQHFSCQIVQYFQIKSMHKQVNTSSTHRRIRRQSCSTLMGLAQVSNVR
jgi:hypothetical protein